MAFVVFRGLRPRRRPAVSVFERSAAARQAAGRLESSDKVKVCILVAD
jgi:hypothetical protein